MVPCGSDKVVDGRKTGRGGVRTADQREIDTGAVPGESPIGALMESNFFRSTAVTELAALPGHRVAAG
jgi:hypothetical protein